MALISVMVSSSRHVQVSPPLVRRRSRGVKSTTSPTIIVSPRSVLKRQIADLLKIVGELLSSEALNQFLSTGAASISTESIQRIKSVKRPARRRLPASVSAVHQVPLLSSQSHNPIPVATLTYP